MEENKSHIKKNQNPSVPSVEKKGRGGKRPGAGAPKGNMNALKHGLRSKQFARIGALIAESPNARETLLQIAERWGNKKLKADQVAFDIISQVITLGLRRGDKRLGEAPEGLMVLPPFDDRRSIVREPSGGVSAGPDAQHTAPKNPAVPAEINQTPDTTPANNHPPDTKSD